MLGILLAFRKLALRRLTALAISGVVGVGMAVAGYGDGGPGYLCTEAAYPEGGYEPTASLVAPKSEAIVKQAIAQLLASGRK